MWLIDSIRLNECERSIQWSFCGWLREHWNAYSLTCIFCANSVWCLSAYRVPRLTGDNAPDLDTEFSMGNHSGSPNRLDKDQAFMRLSTLIAFAIGTCFLGQSQASAQSCHSSDFGGSSGFVSYGQTFDSDYSLNYDNSYSSYGSSYPSYDSSSYPSYDSGYSYASAPTSYNSFSNYAPQSDFYSGYSQAPTYSAPMNYGYSSPASYAPVSYGGQSGFVSPASYSAPAPVSNCANGNCSQSSFGGGWSFGY